MSFLLIRVTISFVTGMQFSFPINQTSHVPIRCSSINCWPPGDSSTVSSTRQTVLPLFITGHWMAVAAVRVIIVITRKNQSSDVVVVILVVWGVPSFVVCGIFVLEKLSCLLSLSVSSGRVVLLFGWVDMVAAALEMLLLLPFISLDFRFWVSVASFEVLLVIGLWFSIWLLFVGSVDCILNRWVGSVFVYWRWSKGFKIIGKAWIWHDWAE